MSFGLEQAQLWRHVEKMAIAPSTFKAKKDNREDWMEKIYAQEEKIVKFEDNIQKIIAKIGKIYTDTV